MRSDKLKGFALGVAVCLSVGALSESGLAASISKQITAYYNDIKLIVNGQTVTPKDVKGNVVEPFIIDGTTYLPVRAVADALKQNVSWDGQTRSVIIGANEELEQPTIWLDQTESLSGKSSNLGDSIKDNQGNEYEHYLSVGEISYALNGQYEKFTGSMVLTSKDSYYCTKTVVLLDGKEVYTSGNFTKDSFPEKFEIDVSNGNLLQIRMLNDYSEGSHVHERFHADSFTNNSCIVNAGLWAAK